MGIWQKRLDRWARWWDTQIEEEPTQVHDQMNRPVFISRVPVALPEAHLAERGPLVVGDVRAEPGVLFGAEDLVADEADEPRLLVGKVLEDGAVRDARDVDVGEALARRVVRGRGHCRSGLCGSSPLF